MMKLSQRMITNFCVSVSSSTTAQQYTTLAGSKDSRVRVTVRKATDPGQPNGLVLCAATSIWLPVSPQTAFDFFRDVRMRPQVSFLNSESFQQSEKIPFFVNFFLNFRRGTGQWDVLSKGNAVQEVAHISCGSHHGNCISILRVCLNFTGISIYK